jgi:hypothetical protein
MGIAVGELLKKDPRVSQLSMKDRKSLGVQRRSLQSTSVGAITTEISAESDIGT